MQARGCPEYWLCLLHTPERKTFLPTKPHPALNCGLMSTRANEDPWEVTSLFHVPDWGLSMDRLYQSCPALILLLFHLFISFSYFYKCLSWTMLPSLRLYPRRKAPSDRRPAASGCATAQGLWHQAEPPSSQTSGWVMAPCNLQLLGQNLQLIGPDQPNTFLKQINVFHQEKKKILLLEIPCDGYLY